jgi:hypothetical protein
MTGLLLLSASPVDQMGAVTKKYVDDINTTINSSITNLSSSTQATLTFTPPLTNSANNISISSASGSTNGYLSSSDWSAFNGKQNALGYAPVNRVGDTMTGQLVLSGLPTASNGAATKSYVDSGISALNLSSYLTISSAGTTYATTSSLTSGLATKLNTTGSIPESQVTNLSSDLATINTAISGKQASLTFSSPMVNTAGAVSMPQSSSSVDGYLSSSDWNNFSGKQASLGYTPVNKVGDTMTGLLLLSANPVNVLGAVTKQYVDSINTTLTAAINGKQGSGSYISGLTGDVSATGSGSVVTTLATVNSNVGTFGSASTSSVFTVNGKGLITSASNPSILIGESQVTGLASDLAIKAPLASPSFTGTLSAGNVSASGFISASNFSGNSSGTNSGDQTITLTGNVTGSGTGSFATTIAASAVTNSMLSGSITASKLVGTDISTVGTITSGTWNAGSVTTSAVSASTMSTPRTDVASTTTMNNLTSASGFVKITGNANFTINGIAAGVDGQHLWIYNVTTKRMTISNEDGAASSYNRVTTMTGSSLQTSGNGTAELIYDSGSSRWILLYLTP